MKSMKTVGFSLFVTALVFCSLLSFPKHVPWMAACWAAIALQAVARSKPCWPWLLASLTILLIKQPGYTLAILLWALTILLIAFHDFYLASRAVENKKTLRRSFAYAILLLLVTTNVGYSRWREANFSGQVPVDERPIVCLGDSLTDYGYPDELASIISLPVVDFGFDGITTDDGIELIPQILDEQPQLVVIELGGHDYNSKLKTRHETKASLEKLITSFLDEHVFVILVEIPRGFITDPYHGLERELAAKYDLQLIDDSVIRKFVYFSPVIPPGSWLDESRLLSHDGLHPNDLGNKYFASKVRDALLQVFGEGIRR